MLQPGDVFLDEFEILSKLGEGGFATVYRARQRRLGREVAIKILRLDDAEAQKRFEQEARLVSQLRDPATVTVHDFGEADGRRYIVLEFVDGKTLRNVLDTEHALGAHRTVAILQQITSALVEAHAQGILHRDIKPDNIMLFNHFDREDQVKVLDFGIAKLLSPILNMTEAGPVTATGKTLGTPRYMAPEMLYGGQVSEASDIFSLGLVAYEMLTGERAVKSASGVVVIRRMLDHNPIVIPPDTDYPPELVALVNAMLLKREQDRIGSAAAVAEALRRLPVFEPDTQVVDPAELAKIRERILAREEQVEDHASTTLPDVPVAPVVDRMTQRLDVQTYTPMVAEPHLDDVTEQGTDERVEEAVRNLKADALEQSLEERKAPPARRPEEQIEVGERPPVIPRGGNDADFSPGQPGSMPTNRLRQLAGFGALFLALLFAGGYFLGIVGVNATITQGDPLECDGTGSSLVIERHFKIAGNHLFRVSREVRCTRGD